jgi:hypothetical protein
MILDYVGDDKPTLAKCMRSSLQLNFLAAPRLYKNIRWSSSASFPLTILPSPDNDSETRISPTKSENLGFIRELHLEAHSLHDCSVLPAKVPKSTRAIRVPVLHYSVQQHAHNSDGTYGPYNHLCTSMRSRCHFLPHIAPTKLVITAMKHQELLPIRSIDQRHLSKIVVDLAFEAAFVYADSEPISQSLCPFFRSSATTKKAVVYMINELPSDECLYPGVYLHLSSHLEEVAYRQNFAQDIIIVNATGRDRGSLHQNRYTCAEQYAIPQESVRKSLASELEEVKEHWEERGAKGHYKEVKEHWTAGGAKRRYKTVSDAEATTIKFMNSREYLENYETEGEFTDDERARLMVTDM